MISKIAKYLIEAELGRGGFGVVYRAYDPDVGRPVAIKVLTAESDHDLFKRFQDEVGTTGNLTHKNIVIVYESGNESGVPYLVMELLSGRTLQEIIKNPEGMPLLEKVRLMTQVAEGLKYAHEKNVIHRDVKPGNVMLLNNGDVKIMDFGIARVTTRSTVVTREGYIIGTIPYMAPEQFQMGGKAERQTDIFAYGAVYYELLTGKHPFSSDGNIYGTIERIKLVEPEPISSLVPECPEALELLIYRAIAKDRDVRYASFEELLFDSEAVFADLAHDRAALVLKEVPALIEAGEIEAAEEKLKEVAELAPGDREARQLRKTIQDEKERRKVATRLPALLEESAAHLQGRRFGEAVQILETALRLTRSDETVRARLTEAKGKLEAHSQANKLLSEARRDQQKGQLPDAVQRLKTALELDSEHVDARALFVRLETEIQRREKESGLQQVIAAASEHLTHKRYEQALAALEEYGPEQTRVTDLRARIARERAEEENRNQVDQFNLAVSDIREALRAHELTRAGELLGRLSGDFADVRGAAQVAGDLRAQYDAQSREDAIAAFSQQARDLIGLKWFSEALNLLEEAIQRFPDDVGLGRLQESAAALLAVQHRSEAMAAALKEANAFRDAGDLQPALDSIAKARTRIGQERAFDDLERQFQMEYQQQRYAAGLADLLSRVQAMVEAGDYAEAIRTIQASQEYEGESELRSALALARTSLAMREEQALVDSTIQAVESFEQEGMLEPANSLLQDARQKYPYNRVLSQAADRVGESLSRKQRQALIAGHQASIEQAVQQADWKSAEACIERAQRECPEESLFEAFADQVRRAQFDAGLDEAASEVRGKLAANAVSEAVQQLNVTGIIYSNDPRWKQLEQEVAQRKAYESGLGHANQEREHGKFAKAEELLTGLIQQGSFDDRVTQMLAEVQDRRISKEIAEANLAVGHGDFDRGLTLMETARLRATPAWMPRIEEAYQGAQREKERVLASAKAQSEREQAIAALAGQAHSLAESGEFARALEEVASGLKQFPDADVLTRLRESLLVQTRAASLACAERLRRDSQDEAALQEIQAALRHAPDDRELLELQGQIQARIGAERHEQELQEVGQRAAALLAQGNPEAAIGLIESLKGGEPRFQELLVRARSEIGQRQESEAYERAHAQLLGLEQRIDVSLRKEKLRELDAEAQVIGKAHGANGEIASLVAGIHQRIESVLRERAKILSTVCSLHEEGKLDAALKAAQAALRTVPDNPELLSVKAKIEAEIEQTRRLQRRHQELEQAGKQAAKLLAQGKHEEVIALIEDRYATEPGLDKLLERARTELRTKQLDQLIARARALGGEGRLEEALQLIEQGAKANGQTAALTELRRSLQSQLDEKQRQEARARDRSQLLAIEKQLETGPEKKKLNQLDAEISRIGAAYPNDQEIARIVEQLKQRIATAAPSESAGTSTVSWKPIAIGLGAAGILVAAVLAMLHRPAPPAALFVEVNSDPPGASVSLGGHSCITPNCRFDVKPGDYQIQAELKGYQPAQRGVSVASSGSPAPVDFTLQPLAVPPPPPGSKTGTLIVQAGMPDAQVFVDNVARGRTDSNGEFSMPLSAATHSVGVEKNGFQKPVDQHVAIADGRVRPISFRMIPEVAKIEPPAARPTQPVPPAQTAPIPKAVQPATLANEARDWELARTAADPAQVQSYLDKYPAGAHTPDAQSRLDELLWSRNDPQAYLSRLPRGAHAVEAAQRMGDAMWSRLDQNDTQALRAFIAQNPNNAHRAQAQTLVDQIEKLKAEETLKQERAKQEPVQKQLEAQRGQQAGAEALASRQQVLAVLEGFNAAFEHKQQRELKAVWPDANKNYLEAVTTAHSALRLMAAGNPEITGDKATVQCSLISEIAGQAKRRLVTITLQKRGNTWVIVSL